MCASVLYSFNPKKYRTNNNNAKKAMKLFCLIYTNSYS